MSDNDRYNDTKIQQSTKLCLKSLVLSKLYDSYETRHRFIHLYE